MLLTPEPLTADAFAPFGDLIDKRHEPVMINEGNTEKYQDLAHLALIAEDGYPQVHIYRSTPLALPLKLSMMERHPLSSQLFFPLSPRPYLVLVAPAGEFDREKLKLFVVQPGQGVNYAPGTWHHYSLALGQPSEFLVVDRGGPEENCDVITLDPPVEVDLSSVKY